MDDELRQAKLAKLVEIEGYDIDMSMRMSSFVHGCRFVVFVAIFVPHAQNQI